MLEPMVHLAEGLRDPGPSRLGSHVVSPAPDTTSLSWDCRVQKGPNMSRDWIWSGHFRSEVLTSPDMVLQKQWAEDQVSATLEG